MNRFILDCSISASWCLKDESNNEANKILDRLGEDEALVPSLWPIEMANVLVVAERRRRISTADAARAVEILLSLPIHADKGNLENLGAIRLMAREHKLSAYDACYLELAQRTGLPIATLDHALQAAAGKCGVTLFSPKEGKKK
ncbi:MAG: type II toxin-antitoxin system VapC family toxin [Deltaproteobacteria bacterium]|nr:type II toxin-antitoxin system VapC family toxin [Deltaproteobacteria bacterium]